MTITRNVNKAAGRLPKHAEPVVTGQEESGSKREDAQCRVGNGLMPDEKAGGTSSVPPVTK
jgi:hypothetical protein